MAEFTPCPPLSSLRRGELNTSEFLCTLFSDIASPCGGELWMGDVVASCRRVGINESRVRTAVSRLRGAGLLQARRDGRRSYYRLSEDGWRRSAAREARCFGPPAPPPLRGWLMAALPFGPDAAQRRERLTAELRRERFGFPNPYLAIRPDRGEPPPQLDAPLFRAESAGDAAALADGWELSALARRMERFVGEFASQRTDTLAPADALILRLLLAHSWNTLAAEDPLLPPGLTPPDWPGPRARRLFARLYLALSPAAWAAVAHGFSADGAPLRPDPEKERARRAALTAILEA